MHTGKCRLRAGLPRRRQGGPDAALSVWAVKQQELTRDTRLSPPLVPASSTHPKRCLVHPNQETSGAPRQLTPDDCARAGGSPRPSHARRLRALATPRSLTSLAARSEHFDLRQRLPTIPRACAVSTFHVCTSCELRQFGTLTNSRVRYPHLLGEKDIIYHIQGLTVCGFAA